MARDFNPYGLVEASPPSLWIATASLTVLLYLSWFGLTFEVSPKMAAAFADLIVATTVVIAGIATVAVVFVALIVYLFIRMMRTWGR